MKLMQKTIWAITPEMLSSMIAIAHQTNRTPEAIAKEMGKDMKNTHAVSLRGGVAVIPVTGPLFRHANLLTAVCGATSYEILAQDFNKALNDPNISAIVFDMDSPGGEVNGCSELSDMIYSAKGKKPIIAYASGSCCSGAYWIASACDKILASDTGILGSIGVVSILEKSDDDKKTIEIVSSQSPNKRPNVETDEGKAKIQAHIDALAEVFISKVALHREVAPIDVIENFGGGDVFVGEQAVRIGLADGLASFEGIITDLNLKAKESFMNEQPQSTLLDIRAEERGRMSAVFTSDIAKGREKTAQMLLAKTDLPAGDILAILETVPSAKPTDALELAMANIKNPEIAASMEDKEETPEDIAARIASYSIGG